MVHARCDSFLKVMLTVDELMHIRNFFILVYQKEEESTKHFMLTLRLLGSYVVNLLFASSAVPRLHRA